MTKVYALVVSDIHLGSQDCRASLLLKTLHGHDFEWLIIVGDLYQEGVINDEQFEVVEFLRRNKKKIICIDGNHDPLEENMVSKIIGIENVKREHWLSFPGRTIYLTHGHRFDKLCFIFSEPLVDWLFLVVISLFKWADVSGRLAKWMDDSHRLFAQHFNKKAKKHISKKDIDGIVCGHTHVAEHETFLDEEGREREYLNLGCWTMDWCSYGVIYECGKMELVFIGES